MVVGLPGNKSPYSNRLTLVFQSLRMMYDYKLNLVVRTPRACPWESSDWNGTLRKKSMCQMGIQTKIDNSLTGWKSMRLLQFSSMIKKIFQSCSEMGDRFFCDDARGTIVTGRMIFSVSAAGFLRAASRIRPTSRPIPVKS